PRAAAGDARARWTHRSQAWCEVGSRHRQIEIRQDEGTDRWLNPGNRSCRPPVDRGPDHPQIATDALQTFRVTDDQITSRPEKLLNSSDHILLGSGREIDHYIAQKDDVERLQRSEERRVGKECR